MAFERFTKTKGRVYTPKIGIWKRGQIGFNQPAVDKLEMEKFEYAVLFYDSDNKRVGFQFTNDANEEGACKIIKRKTGGFSITGTSFLKFYRIDHSKTCQYDTKYDEGQSIWYIDLKQNEGN